MAQQVITEFFDQAVDRCTVHVNADGVTVFWGEDCDPSDGEGRVLTWDDMEKPELLISMFFGIRVGIFAQFAKFLAKIHSQRELYKELLQ